MILFTILLIMLTIIGIITLATFIVGGVSFLFVFGDLIIFIALIVWLVRRRFK